MTDRYGMSDCVVPPLDVSTEATDQPSAGLLSFETAMSMLVDPPGWKLLAIRTYRPVELS